MSGATDAAGVLLNTIVEDAHIESHPDLAPSTLADDKPVLVDTAQSTNPAKVLDECPDIVPEVPRKKTNVLGSGQPLIDLRHEQTYLTALNKTDGSWLAIAKVTLVDFLIVPTITNSFWVLGLDGFKFLRTGSTRSGRKFGELIKDFLNVGGVLD